MKPILLGISVVLVLYLVVLQEKVERETKWRALLERGQNNAGSATGLTQVNTTVGAGSSEEGSAAAANSRAELQTKEETFAGWFNGSAGALIGAVIPMNYSAGRNGFATGAEEDHIFTEDR
ncbi:hypothetical protein BV25DRAFT_1921603 [Artomyces pyxidatus]|uniref:Uncharacterized protein n=1 Tax=Artomyces pyxidatus TaxID=48021 RepID=A0ACB8SIS3_9AGAM|nr:hypothetical protein BV25DRAFT_1921603 [Artomyces pyxidatus]